VTNGTYKHIHGWKEMYPRLEFDPWHSSYCKSSSILLFRFCGITLNFCNSSLATLRCPPYFGWYARTFVSDLKLYMIPMLFSFCWSSPYALKMLMKDFRLSLSQFESSDMLKEFCLWTFHHNLVNLGKIVLVGMGCAWIWGKLKVFL
jgi:hypothetical protein